VIANRGPRRANSRCCRAACTAISRQIVAHARRVQPAHAGSRHPTSTTARTLRRHRRQNSRQSWCRSWLSAMSRPAAARQGAQAKGAAALRRLGVTEAVSSARFTSARRDGGGGADIVFAEGSVDRQRPQFRRVPMSGLFATRDNIPPDARSARRRDVDSDGKRCWVLTLSTRDSHILPKMHQPYLPNACCAPRRRLHGASVAARQDGLPRA